MFNLKTGLAGPDLELITNQSLVASTMHLIAKKAVTDTSILVFHQFAADIYYREDEGIKIDVGDDGKYVLYSPEEEEEIRKELGDIVMKYHILHPKGLVAQLTPLTNYVTKGIRLSDSDLSNDYIKEIIKNQDKFRTTLMTNPTPDSIMKDVLNFSDITNANEDDNQNMLVNSYNWDTEISDDVDVAVYENGSVQCNCNRCIEYFSVLKDDFKYEELNPLQELLKQHYNF